jgi:hypothetical protein
MIGQIPHLIPLSSRIRQATDDDSEKQILHEFYLEQLQYTIYLSANAVISLAQLFGEAKKYFPPIGSDGKKHIGTVILPEPIKNQLCFAVDHYFDGSRRSLNAVNVFLSKTLKISVPSSFSKLIKRLNSDKIKLPERILTLVLNYWNSDGRLIKAYRDLSQHFAVISSDARAFLSPDGKILYYLLLPNNPEEKNPTKFCYEDPRIDAFPFIFESYKKLYEFIFELTHILFSYTSNEGTETVPVIFKSPLRLGGKQKFEGHYEPNIENINRRLFAKQVEIKKKLDAELPRNEITPTLIVKDSKRV